MSDFELFQSLIDASKSNQNKDMVARFYDRSLKTSEVDENGLPIFKDVCFIEIRVKDSHDVFDQPASEDKKKRFPIEYNRYLLAKKQIKDGSPLEQFAFLTAAEIDRLKYRGIFTVEALAALDKEKAADLNLKNEHELAVRFLQNAQNNLALNKSLKIEEDLKRQLKEKDNRIAALQNELATVQQKLNALKQKRKATA